MNDDLNHMSLKEQNEWIAKMRKEANELDVSELEAKIKLYEDEIKKISDNQRFKVKRVSYNEYIDTIRSYGNMKLFYQKRLDKKNSGVSKRPRKQTFYNKSIKKLTEQIKNDSQLSKEEQDDLYKQIINLSKSITARGLTKRKKKKKSKKSIIALLNNKRNLEDFAGQRKKPKMGTKKKKKKIKSKSNTRKKK